MDFTLDELKNLTTKFALLVKHWMFGNKAQLAFLEDLHLLINDGIPANRAVDMMSQITEGLTQEVAISLSEKIAQGKPLAEGMQDWFTPNIVEIIRVGESGGALTQTMQSAINALSQRGIAMGAVISAISYPLFVIVMACGVIVYLNSSVFVQFRSIKPIEQWPEAGRRLVTIANGVESWWWFIILLVISLIIIFRKLMTNYVGDFRPLLDNFPPFSFYRRFVAGQFLETLGLLVANGVVFKSAIKVMQYQANPYLESHLAVMERLLAMGRTNIADVLATGLVSNEDL